MQFGKKTSTGLSGIKCSNTPNYIYLDDPKIPESIDNCTKDEVRGDFLRPQHKHLTPDKVDINTFWGYELPPEANNAHKHGSILLVAFTVNTKIPKDLLFSSWILLHTEPT